MEDSGGSLCFLNRKQTNNRDRQDPLFPWVIQICEKGSWRLQSVAILRIRAPSRGEKEMAHVRNYTRLKYPSRWKTIQDEVDPEIYSNSNSVSLVWTALILFSPLSYIYIYIRMYTLYNRPSQNLLKVFKGIPAIKAFRPWIGSGDQAVAMKLERYYTRYSR